VPGDEEDLGSTLLDVSDADALRGDEPRNWRRRAVVRE
jgi:hypothetical protein